MLLVIDESGDDTGDENRYVIAAACVANASDLPELNARLRQTVFASTQRSREFHWRREGHRMRPGVLSLLTGHGAIAVVDRVSVAADQEQARSACLLEPFRRVGERGVAVEHLMIETREIQPVNRGQNHRDHSTIVEARHRGLVRPRVTYNWYPKPEPVGWLADAIAGAAMEALRGDESTLAQLRGFADWFDLVFIDEDGRKNA